MYEFEELDSVTRKWMLEEWEAEQSRLAPFRSTRLSPGGLAVVANHMRDAVVAGNEKTLAAGLADPALWVSAEPYERSGRQRYRTVNPQKAAEFFAGTEFLTWYVRGFARRLLEERETYCVVYRVAPAWEPRDECLAHEGQRYAVRDVYDGHRARYWPPPGSAAAFSIPTGTNCHHAIRRRRDAERA